MSRETLANRLSSENIFEFLVECAVEELATYLVRAEKLSETDALERIYHSDFYTRLKNRKTGLFGESRASLIYLYNKYGSMSKQPNGGMVAR